MWGQIEAFLKTDIVILQILNYEARSLVSLWGVEYGF